MTGYSAIAPGTDLSQHARVLTRVHDAVLAATPRGSSSRGGRPLLVASAGPGRLPHERPRAAPLPDGGNRRRWIVLWREGSAQVRLRADSLRFHFEQVQHPWCLTAAPIHHPVSGEMLGVVDVSGPALTVHPVIGALVESAVKLAESRLWRHHEQRLERLRQSARGLLATAHGSLLLVEDDGWVAHQPGIAVRDRVEVPRAEGLIAVPGLGLCAPERLGEGWLIRRTRLGTTSWPSWTWPSHRCSD